MKIYWDGPALYLLAEEKANAYRLLKLLIKENHTAMTCDWAIEEAIRNIEIHCSNATELWKERIAKFKQITGAPIDTTIIIEDNYRPSISAALHGKCSYFLTADKWLYNNYGSTPIRRLKIVSLEKLTRILLNIGDYLEVEKAGAQATVTYSFSSNKRTYKKAQKYSDKGSSRS